MSFFYLVPRRRMGWPEYIGRMEEIRNAYGLSGKPKSEETTWKVKAYLVYNIKYGVRIWRVDLCGRLFLTR